MSCEHRYLDNPDGLPCTRIDPHDAGHTYTSGSGSELDDRHGEASHG